MDVVAGLEAGDELPDRYAQLVQDFRERREPAGFGHQLHDRDPRRDRMIELVEEAAAEGNPVHHAALELEAALARRSGVTSR
jgi:citrate synthase